MQLTSEPRGEVRPSLRCKARVEKDIMSEEAFYALQARLAGMSDAELTAFRADPANRRTARQYDAYALRQVLPYLALFIIVSAASIATGILLSA